MLFYGFWGVHVFCAQPKYGASSWPQVIGVGVAGADPELLLLRLMYSIDVPYNKFVIVTPAGEPGIVLKKELEHISLHFPDVVMAKSQSKWLGCAETWNIILKAFPQEPWAFIVSVDLQFASGALGALAAGVWGDVQSGSVDFGYIDYADGTMSKGFGAFYSAFVITQSLLGRVGYFDENIHPAYYEVRYIDSVYGSRAQHSSVFV